MNRKKTRKRLLCILLTLGFIATDFAGLGRDVASMAAEKKQSEEAQEAALKKKLAKSKKEYPRSLSR